MDEKIEAKKYGVLTSFEMWVLALLLVVFLDANITLIGTHRLGLYAEGNPIVLWNIVNGNYWAPFVVLPVLVFAVIGLKYLWYCEHRWARIGVRIVGWGVVFLWAFIGPFSWLSYVYLGL